ncbi:hypothetical protein WDU94_012499 [Cyamophila willieti]
MFSSQSFAQDIEDDDDEINTDIKKPSIDNPRKQFYLLDEDYYANLHQNDSGIILKVSGIQLHPDTERYLVSKLRHMLIYGMKKMALHANYTDDNLDQFYLKNRINVKKKMCDIFLKLYNDFTFKGLYESKKFIQLRTYKGDNYLAMKSRKAVQNFWTIETQFDEKCYEIRHQLRKTLTNILVYFERCHYYHYYRKRSLARLAYQWNHHDFDEDVNYFQFQVPD